MAVNDLNHVKLPGMDGNGWKLLKITDNCLNWLDMAGNGWKLPEVARIG